MPRAAARVLFLDEVHRFNKAQQDAFLPYVEDGTLTFVGATTENPSFEVNSALLSRARVYVLRSLTVDDIVKLLRRALEDPDRGLGRRGIAIDDAALVALAHGGRWRRTPCAQHAGDRRGPGRGERRPAHDHDRTGARKSPPAAAAGSTRAASSSTTRSRRCTSRCAAPIPTGRCTGSRACSTAAATLHYLARRIVRMAVEDIGLADPRGAATGARGLADLRSARHSRRRAGTGPGGRLSRRWRRRAMRSTSPTVRRRRRGAIRHARSAAAFPQRADQTHEGPGIRCGVSIRARRTGGFRERRTLSSRRDARPALLPACAARPRDQDRGGAGAVAWRTRGAQRQSEGQPKES